MPGKTVNIKIENDFKIGELRLSRYYKIQWSCFK